MDGVSVPVVSLQPQPHSVPATLNRSDEANVEHSPHTAGGILYERAHTNYPTETPGDQTRTSWSDHNHCPAHTPTQRDGHIQLVRDLNGPLFGAPTTHPYRSSAPLQYYPGDRPHASGAVSTTLDSSSGADTTFAQRTDTGGGNDRPFGDSWSPGFQPPTDNNEFSKRESYLHSTTDGVSASSSPAPPRSADGPDSSPGGEHAATDLSTSSDATPELAKADPDGGVATDLVSQHVPPNVNIGLLQPDFLPGVGRVHDTPSALHRVQRSPSGSLGIAKPAKLKSILKKNVSLVSSVYDSSDTEASLIIDEYLEDFPLADTSVSPTKDFSDIDTLMGPDNLEITVAPSLLIPTQPKYFKVSPLPPYWITLRPKKEQKYPIQNICTLGPGHNRTIETTVKVTERTVDRVATPGIKKTPTSPKPTTDPTVLTATYPNHPNFKVAVVDPVQSFPCITNQQVYPAEQAAQIMADNITITELNALNECETYRWDVIFSASHHRLDRLSVTTDAHSKKRYINLLTNDHIFRWQIVTPHDDAVHAAHSPFTWNTHIYFAKADHPSYVQSYQLN